MARIVSTQCPKDYGNLRIFTHCYGSNEIFIKVKRFYLPLLIATTLVSLKLLYFNLAIFRREDLATP